MKMYKILPLEKRITEVDYDGSYTAMKANIKYDWLDHCRINSDGDMVFVNDLDLLDDTYEKDGVFYIHLPSCWIMLAGEALYWGTDYYGKNASPHNSLEQVENIISWTRPHSVEVQ